MKLFQKLRSLWGMGPVAILHTVLDRVPFQPIQFAIYRRYEFPGYPDPPRQPAETMSTRPADPSDLERLVRCLDKRSIYERRFQAGEHCLVAVVDDAIVGYEWFSTKNRLYEERYRYPITPPADALYAYDAFTSEAHRGRGVWSQILLAATELMKRERRSRLISHIDYGNEGSMAAHAKVGFRPGGWYLFVYVFGLQILKQIS
jgi:L-amino acid N-acyltransferase YncA